MIKKSNRLSLLVILSVNIFFSACNLQKATETSNNNLISEAVSSPSNSPDSSVIGGGIIDAETFLNPFADGQSFIDVASGAVSGAVEEVQNNQGTDAVATVNPGGGESGNGKGTDGGIIESAVFNPGAFIIDGWSQYPTNTNHLRSKDVARCRVRYKADDNKKVPFNAYLIRSTNDLVQIKGYGRLSRPGKPSGYTRKEYNYTAESEFRVRDNVFIYTADSFKIKIYTNKTMLNDSKFPFKADIHMNGGSKYHPGKDLRLKCYLRISYLRKWFN